MRVIYLSAMPFRAIFCLVLLIANAQVMFGQLAGTRSFVFTGLPSTARLAGLGGMATALSDRDVALTFFNPAAISSEMHNRATITYNNMVGDINYGYAGYGYNFKKAGMFTAGGMYLDYGKFKGYDDGGNKTEDFKANESCLHITWGKPLNAHWQAGASVKFAYSAMGAYISTAAMADLGAIYNDTAKKFTAGFAIRNIGMQLLSYTDGTREKLPFDIQAGISKKLEHLPFRFFITAHNLQKWDLTYNQYLSTGQIDLLTQQPLKKESSFGDKLMRHFNFGGELGGKGFGLMFGYSHQRRREMNMETGRRLSGFAWGLNLKVRKIMISYSSLALFPGYSNNMFTVTTNVSELAARKK